MNTDKYLAMLTAITAGDTATADRLTLELAVDERRHDAAARNRALLGPDSSRERNRTLVGRPRGPLGEAS